MTQRVFGLLSLIISLLSFLALLVSYIPIFGWLVWFILPVAILGLLLGVFPVLISGGHWLGITGVISNSLAIVICLIRLS
jgi:hypothetical protein